MSFVIRNLTSLSLIRCTHLIHFRQIQPSIKYAPNLSHRNYRVVISRNMSSHFKSIGLEDLKKHQEQGTLIIDVREPKEIAETGILPGGINIPLGQVDTALSKSDEEFESCYGRPKPSKDQEIVFSCRSGKRSMQATQKAVELGYTNVINFNGGWNEWESNMKQ